MTSPGDQEHFGSAKMQRECCGLPRQELHAAGTALGYAPWK